MADNSNGMNRRKFLREGLWGGCLGGLAASAEGVVWLPEQARQ